MAFSQTNKGSLDSRGPLARVKESVSKTLSVILLRLQVFSVVTPVVVLLRQRHWPSFYTRLPARRLFWSAFPPTLDTLSCESGSQGIHLWRPLSYRNGSRRTTSTCGSPFVWVGPRVSTYGRRYEGTEIHSVFFTQRIFKILTFS